MFSGCLLYIPMHARTHIPNHDRETDRSDDLGTPHREELSGELFSFVASLPLHVLSIKKLFR